VFLSTRCQNDGHRSDYSRGFLVVVVNAQEQLFPVEGFVGDEMGAAIPHAELLFKAESGTIVAQAGADGVVRVMLGTGHYAVTIVQCGFKTTKLADFSVQGPTVGASRVVLQG
jgi:hypothetical protein